MRRDTLMELHAPKSNGTAIIGLVMSEIVQMLHHCMVNKTIAAQIKMTLLVVLNGTSEYLHSRLPAASLEHVHGILLAMGKENLASGRAPLTKYATVLVANLEKNRFTAVSCLPLRAVPL